FVKGGRTDSVFTCDFLNAFTSLEFLKDLTDLLRFESFPFHNTLLKLSIIFYSLTVFFSGKLTYLFADENGVSICIISTRYFFYNLFFSTTFIVNRQQKVDTIL